MAKKLELRPVGVDEEREVRALGASRTAAARLVQRAKVIVFMLDDPALPADAAGRRAGYRSREAGRTWVKRFNAGGLEALEDRSRSGCPRTHSLEVRSALVDLATQKPRSLGLDFNLWTLEKLQREFKVREGVHLSDSTIWTWLSDEGLHWKRQQTW